MQNRNKPLPAVRHTFFVCIKSCLKNHVRIFFVVSYYIINKKLLIIRSDSMIINLTDPDRIIIRQTFQICKDLPVDHINILTELEKACTNALVRKVITSVIPLHKAVVHIADEMRKINLCPVISEHY